MNTQNLHPLDIFIASNPATVTFYKKITRSRWTATFEEIYFQM